MSANSPDPLQARPIFHLLLSPWAVFAGMALGCYIGFFHKILVPYVAPVGDLYLSILKMCILPILLAAIGLSMGQLIRANSGGGYLGRILGVFFGAMVLVSVIGVVAGIAGQPGSNLSGAALDTLGEVVNTSRFAPDMEISFSKPYHPEVRHSMLVQFLDNLVPSNIFRALSSDSNLQVLFFAIVFGVALGFLKGDPSTTLFHMLDATFQAFSKVVQALMYLLPFGICGLLAKQFADVGIDILLAMTKFVAVALLAFAVLFVVNILIVWWRSGNSLKNVLLHLREPIIIAMGTCSSLACIPSTLASLSDGLRFNARNVGLLVPLGITICRFGNVLYFAVASLFIAQLYHFSLGIESLAIILITCVLAGMATAGASGMLTLTMLSLVLDPLGLPLEAVLVLFLVVDPLIDPFRTLTNVLTNVAATTLITQVESAPESDASALVGAEV